MHALLNRAQKKIGRDVGELKCEQDVAALPNPDLTTNYSKAGAILNLLSDTTTLPLSFCLCVVAAWKVTWTQNH